jgi:hypothetical protein
MDSPHRFTELNLLSRVLDVTLTTIEAHERVPEADVVGAAVAKELRLELQQLGVGVGPRERDALGVLGLALARAAADAQEDDG